MTNDGVNTYTWNSRNELTSISGTGLNAAFTYDAFGRRSSRTVNGSTTEFLYDGVDAVQEKVGGTPSANLLLGALDQTFTRTDAAGTFHFLRDAQGSTQSLTDATGTPTTEYTYEPFGQTSITGASNGNSSQYTGRENDGTGLYYYRARYYSPTLQRFLSEDPIGFIGGDINLYNYAANDPVNVVDPSGEAIPLLGAAAAAVILILLYPKFANAPGPNDPIYNNDPAQEMVNDIPMMVGGGYVLGKFGKFIGGLVGRACKRVFARKNPLGDLTREEIKQIQKVVDKAGRPIEVVGSAANGTRRGVGSNLPIGKGPGTRSDIDYLLPPGSRPYYKGLEKQLPGLDPKSGIIPGTHNPYMGPAIRFEPGVAPYCVPGVN